jgi:glycosyltransferase involved in cell wall biosynthesis
LKIALLTLTRGTVSGGYRKYLDRLVPLLRKRPEIENVTLFVPPQMAAPDVTVWRSLGELRRMVAAARPDVIFVPTATLLRVGRIPVVTMVHNMEPLEVPFDGNSLKDGMKNVVRSAASRYACLRSNRVIAVSKHVRDFLLNRWHISPEKIGVVHPGVDPAAMQEPQMPAALAPVAGGRFLFTAGSIRPARGLEDVIDALASLPEDVKLVIAGSVDRGAEHYREGLTRLMRERGVESRVLWAGHVDRSGMSWCFRNAAFFVMTSHVEACPNIVLEAMAEAAPTVSTDKQPMPELLGDAAVYYRARDAAHLAEQLNAALAKRAGSWKEMGERARGRSEAFNWEATARGVIAELQQAIDRCAS